MVLPEPPEPIAGSEWFWDAWVALQSCRPMVGGMGLMSLPLRWPDVQGYAEWLGLGSDSAMVLHAVIRALDRVHLDHQAEEARKRDKG